MAWHLTELSEFLRDLYSLDEHGRREQCTLQYAQSFYKVGFKIQDLNVFWIWIFGRLQDQETSKGPL